MDNNLSDYEDMDEYDDNAFAPLIEGNFGVANLPKPELPELPKQQVNGASGTRGRFTGRRTSRVGCRRMARLV
jgi:hypothetical protein